MDRRKFLAGIGSLTAGSAVAMGTGAFTSVQADRGIEVDTAGDANAFLAIEAMNTPNGNEYVENSGNGTVKLDFTETSNGANGVNRNGFTVFDDLLKITNQGTQSVYVGYRQSFKPQKGALYHEDPHENNDGQLNIDTAPTGSDKNPNLVELRVGETLTNIGFFVTPEADASTDFIESGTVTFVAGDEYSDL